MVRLFDFLRKQLTDTLIVRNCIDQIIQPMISLIYASYYFRLECIQRGSSHKNILFGLDWGRQVRFLKDFA